VWWCMVGYGVMLYMVRCDSVVVYGRVWCNVKHDVMYAMYGGVIVLWCMVGYDVMYGVMYGDMVCMGCVL